MFKKSKIPSSCIYYNGSYIPILGITPMDNLNDVIEKLASNVNLSNIDKNFVFDQSLASKIWTINHPLNKYPSVSIMDTAHTIIEGQVEWLSLHQIRITFNAPVSGIATLN